MARNRGNQDLLRDRHHALQVSKNHMRSTIGAMYPICYWMITLPTRVENLLDRFYRQIKIDCRSHSSQVWAIE